ncbi:MAG: hypothetical protein IJW30_01030 [Clostridia bacterium]|nr:hypothetical protein [Clostridia bacterium]
MPYQRKKEVQDTIGETESFFSRNARLLAFLISITVFLGVFIPLALFGPWGLSEWLESCASEDVEREEMTLDDVRAIAEKHKYLSMQALEPFEREEYHGEEMGLKYVSYQITVEGDYYLLANFNETTGMVTYLSLTDLKTGEALDLLENPRDLDAFLASTARTE